MTWVVWASKVGKFFGNPKVESLHHCPTLTPSMEVVFVRKARIGTFVFSLNSFNLPFLKWATIALVG